MRVLVTGQNSYAGTQFAKRISQLNKGWIIDFISLRNEEWESKNFSNYDAVYHVAGIVHKKETEQNKNLYYKINRDLTHQLAIKAKNEGVKTFVFLSTMAVYGLIGKIGEDTIISKKTTAVPASHYGKSKLEAEELLETLKSPEFNIAILRTPMIYGPDCPGNYRSLSKLARKIPVFPNINNKRSMIFVDHLSDIVAYIVKEKGSGVLLVKNPSDVNTSEMVNVISKYHNKKICNSVLAGILVRLLGNKVIVTRKMFSSVFYEDTDCSISGFEYTNLSFEESIAKAERKELGDKH